MSTKVASRASEISPFASSLQIGIITILCELVGPSVELQELLIEAEDPYFELKNGGLRAVKQLFELEEVLAQLRFIHSEVRLG